MAGQKKIKSGIDRRSILKGLAGTAAVSLLGGAQKVTAASSKNKAVKLKANPDQARQMIWQLDRPKKPALPNSYFWTWDHSTNWMLDDPGVLNFGCGNKYVKRPETYIEDYRRLTDFSADLGVKGITL